MKIINRSPIPNFILITFDSCRWDSYISAYTPNIDSFFKFKKAYTQATYTLPSHLSMYQGLFPSSRIRIRYYNRFAKPLLRIDEREEQIDAFINFPKGTKNIFEGFRVYGQKKTLGIGAMNWFHHPSLTEVFERFEFTGTNLLHQIEIARDFIDRNSRLGFAMLLNIGETHEPYEFGSLIQPSLRSRARARTFLESEYDSQSHKKQIKALEFIDQTIFSILEILNDECPTLVVCCSDHGDCFGEDGLWGHGFYHPKVMEVPLGIRVIGVEKE